MLDPPPYLVPHSQEETIILYEDADLLLVRKPDLLLSVPGRHPLNKDCLITRLQQRYPTASMVHRLDLDTSGIMVIPLNKATHAHISRQFQERRVKKSYHAVVYGVVTRDSGEIDLPIAVDWENRPRQVICHQRGKAALTRYEVLQRESDRTRLLLQPVTGRSTSCAFICESWVTLYWAVICTLTRPRWPWPIGCYCTPPTWRSSTRLRGYGWKVNVRRTSRACSHCLS